MFCAVESLMEYYEYPEDTKDTKDTFIDLCYNREYTKAKEIFKEKEFKVDDNLLRSLVVIKDIPSDIAERVIDLGANVNHRGSTSELTNLMWACRYKNFDLVKLLLKRGADPGVITSRGHTALNISAVELNLDIFKTILGLTNTREIMKSRKRIQGASNTIQYYFLCAFREAQSRISLGKSKPGSHDEFLEFLITLGADVNEKTPNGGHFLIEAVINHDLEMVKFLLRHGASVNSRNSDNCNALYYAIRYKHKEIVAELSEYRHEIVEGYPDASLVAYATRCNQRLRIVVSLILERSRSTSC